MSEISFEVKQEALALVKNTVIEANFAECEAALTEMMAPYKTMVVTEDGIAAAKTDRANIRKVAGRIDEMRKVVKKAYTEPLKAFEDKCKALVSICDEGSANLDSQIKAFEDAEKQEKLAAIRADYDEHITDEMELYCPWERVYNPKWENKGYSIELAQEEIYEAIMGTANDLDAIREMGGDDTPYLLDVYRQTHSMTAVVRKASELQTVREREEKRALEESERQKKREQAVAVENARIEGMIHANEVADSIHAKYATKAEDLVTVSFKVTCTKAQLSALGEYMKRSGIKYGRA